MKTIKQVDEQIAKANEAERELQEEKANLILKRNELVRNCDHKWVQVPTSPRQDRCEECKEIRIKPIPKEDIRFPVKFEINELKDEMCSEAVGCPDGGCPTCIFDSRNVNYFEEWLNKSIENKFK